LQAGEWNYFNFAFLDAPRQRAYSGVSQRGANRPSAGTTKAESSARNAEDPWNLIQVMLA
jgi:hypothetical protein